MEDWEKLTLVELKSAHSFLDKQVAKLQREPIGVLRVGQLKRQKLWLKEEICRRERLLAAE